MSQTAFDTTWERNLVEAILSFADEPDAFTAMDAVKPEWFVTSFYRNMWSLILKVYYQHGSLDLICALGEVDVTDWSQTDRAKAREMLSSTFNFACMPSSIGSSLKRAREAFMRRETTKRLDRLTRELQDMTIPVDETIRGATETLAFFQTDAAGHDMKESTFEAEVELYIGGAPLMDDSKAQMVKFGIAALDAELMSGPGSLGVMAAKTSAGKTSLAIQSAVETYLAGGKVAIFSLEMSDEELAARLIACVTGEGSGTVMRGNKDRDVFLKERLRSIAKGIHKVCKIPGKTFEGVAGKMRELKLRYGTNVFFVDYFTLLNPPDTKNKSASVAYQLGEMSKGFKALAGELQATVVLLSQFNRGVEDGQRPQLENLRETGQLEQDANWILMMWTDKASYEPNEDRMVNLELQKHRGGKRWFRAKASFKPGNSRFAQTESKQEEQQTAPKDYLKTSR